MYFCLMFRVILFFLITFSFVYNLSFSQNDSLPFNSYHERVVLSTSFSYKGAPFNLQGSFDSINQLNYQANLNLIHGIGVAYKWFSLNINYKLPNYTRSTEKYGKTKYFDVGLRFNLKKLYFSLNFTDYNGYGIKGADKLSDSLPVSPVGYYLNNNLKSWGLGLNVYYLINPDLNMKAAIGAVSRYTGSAHGFYLRFTTSVYGISSERSLIPYEYLSSPHSSHKASSISAIDFGAVPGYAYLNNINGWQFGAFAGLGGVIQAKSYQSEETSRSFLGLAPRFDIRIQGGYNVSNWFLMFNATFDHSSIEFSHLQYNQLYFAFQLTYGYRFKEKEDKEVQNNFKLTRL